ncbi:MAG: hypothetical protein EON59_06325 [Alphaproteobacteria bacterium]|nr:MAG: hypothetical protein EON59_06325 [Alphaproteobacteria bacterium]
MRLLAIAGLSLLASPTQAQRVDTRVIDVQQMADGRERCRFQAVPDLHMTEAHRGTTDAIAEWAHKARDGNAWLHARFTPADPQGRILIIEIPLTRAIVGARSAEIRIDADASPTSFKLTRTWHGSDRWTLVPANGAALAAAMRYTDLLAVRLLGARGNRLASYEFWIGDLQDVAEYPALVDWRCG